MTRKEKVVHSKLPIVHLEKLWASMLTRPVNINYNSLQAGSNTTSGILSCLESCCIVFTSILQWCLAIMWFTFQLAKFTTNRI